MPQLDPFAENALSTLPASLQSAIEQAPISNLDSGPQVAGLAKLLVELLVDDSSDQWPSVSAAGRSLCLSGLWLLAGDLDRSHSISQNIGSAEGSFWHGIMHRREGDFGNSKYWFRKVGRHPVVDQLADLSEGVYADPFEFVDRCSDASQNGNDTGEQCRSAQWLEWQALMAHCIAL
jgi:hypothetical protein